jgi:hypothetical protein
MKNAMRATLLYLLNPLQTEWELAVVKITIPNSEDLDGLMEEGDLTQDNVMEKLGEGVAVLRCKQMSLRQATKHARDKIQSRGLLSYEEFSTNGSKYKMYAKTGLTVYGVAELAKVPESIRLQALGGGTW